MLQTNRLFWRCQWQ